MFDGIRMHFHAFSVRFLEENAGMEESWDLYCKCSASNCACEP